MARTLGDVPVAVRDTYAQKLKAAQQDVKDLKWLAGNVGPDDVVNLANAFGVPPKILDRLLQGVQGVAPDVTRSTVRNYNSTTINTDGGDVHVWGDVQVTTFNGKPSAMLG